MKTCHEFDNRHDDKSSSTRALFSILGINWEWISHGFDWAPHSIFSIQRAFGTNILGKPYKSYTGPRGAGRGGGGLCVEIGFTQTFPRNQDVSVKLKFELIFIKFKYFFNVLADPKSIYFTQTIPSMCEP